MKPPLPPGTPGYARPGSDKLEELERRYSGPKRSVSPSPESADAVRFQLPGIKVSVSPEQGEARASVRFKKALPWTLSILALFGISGASLVGYIRSFDAGRARMAAFEAKQNLLEDQNAQLKAVVSSLQKRVKTLEAAPDAPLVVTK